MKSIKCLLAVLAISAMFASCAKEEMVTVQENGEFVGAKLIGTGISVNFERDSQTKLTVSGWEDTDELGLVWAINNAFNVPQDPSTAPAEIGAYSNHLFMKGDNGRFTTKGNVYEGWHFAYFPFSYKKTMGNPLKVTVNPEQEMEMVKEYLNTSFYISAREFLTENNLDENNNLKDVEYDMFSVFNTIAVQVEPSEMFTKSPVLSKLTINDITLNAGAGIFNKTVQVDPTKLPAMVYDAQGNYDKAATKKAFYDNLKSANPAVAATSSSLSNMTTVVTTDAIDLSKPQQLRFHVLPKKANIDPANVTFTINVDGGYFTLGYTEVSGAHPVLSDVEKYNNDAITALVNAYKTGGSMTEYNADILPLKIQLTGDMFHEDFTKIDSENAWDNAVAVANALERETATFNIVQTPAATPFNWAFRENDSEGNLITLPNAELTVTGVPMEIGADGEWPAEGIIPTAVYVKEGVTLSVNDNVTLDATVHNDGIINVGKKATVQTIDNEHGRVNVVYGSYLKLDAGKHGTIAYNVTGKDKAYQINYLTQSGNALGDARVNTLVLNNKTFDLSMVDEDVENNDPYNGSVTPGASLERMNEMTFELNNGILKADANSGEKVLDVVVLGGTKNAIWSTNIINDLTIKAGKVTVDAEEIGTYKESLKVEGSIDNKAELVANVNVYTKNIKNPAGAKTTVTEGNTIWYTTEYKQGGTATGTIEKLEDLPGVFTTEVIDESSLSTDPDPVVAAKANGVLLRTKISSAPAGATITLPEGNYNFNGSFEFNKSFTLVGTEGAVIESENLWGIVIDGKKDGCEVTIKNIKLTTKANANPLKNRAPINVKNNATVNLQNVEIVSCVDAAIVLDSANDIDGVFVPGITTTVNAYDVIVNGKKIDMIARPCHLSNPALPGYHTNKTYCKFNYNGGDITDALCVENGSGGNTGDNIFVNGKAI